MAIALETVVGLPEVTGFGREAAEYAETMRAMKPPVKDKYQTFFTPADEPPAELTDPAEREKAIRHSCQKIASKYAGTARRISKEDATKKFAVRTGHQNPDDPASPMGVRVYRIAAE